MAVVKIRGWGGPHCTAEGNSVHTNEHVNELTFPHLASNQRGCPVVFVFCGANETEHSKREALGQFKHIWRINFPIIN